MSTSTILRSVLSGLHLFVSDLDEAYASVAVGGIREAIPVNSREFRRYVDLKCYETYGKIPKNAERADVLATIEAIARYQGPRSAVYVRVGHLDGVTYLDLADVEGRAVRITPDGWEVVTECPAHFRRPKGSLPLPIPERGGSVELLRPFLNVSEHEFPLAVGAMLSHLEPAGPHPIVVIQGEHGNGKSSTAKVIKNITDPNTVPLRSLPHTERDLAVTAFTSWVMSFDNVSGLAPGQSDWLCRLATGGGIALRQLYTDSSVVLLPLRRPVIINGIDDIAVRGDLLDRAIVLHPPRILDAHRVDEATFWGRFQQAWPKILGALLTAASTALRELENTTLLSSPRMADFTRWTTAAEPAFGWKKGSFLAAYDANRKEANGDVLEREALATVLRTWIEARATSWTGTAAQLYDELDGLATPKHTRSSTWPRAANALGSQLRRLAPVLRSAGIDVTMGRRTSHARIITITPAQPSQPTQPSCPAESSTNHGVMTMMTTMTAAPVSSANHGLVTVSEPKAVEDTHAETMGTLAAMTTMTPMTVPQTSGDDPIVSVTTEDEDAGDFARRALFGEEAQ